MYLVHYVLKSKKDKSKEIVLRKDLSQASTSVERKHSWKLSCLFSLEQTLSVKITLTSEMIAGKLFQASHTFHLLRKLMMPL